MWFSGITLTAWRSSFKQPITPGFTYTIVKLEFRIKIGILHQALDLQKSACVPHLLNSSQLHSYEPESANYKEGAR